MEASLKSYMELWEQRNKDAHSPEVHIHLAKEQAAKATRKLYKLQRHALFRDLALVPASVKTCIKVSTAQKLQRYILVNSKAIRQSVRQTGTTATRHTKYIINWFRPVQEESSVTLQQHPLDNLVHDAYSKKKRHRPESAWIDRIHQP